jgi:GTP-binding protein Era
VFLDTPGIHDAKGLLHQQLVASALGVLTDVDLIVFMIEAARRSPDEQMVVEAPGRAWAGR